MYENWEQLKADCMQCRKCGLCETRTNLVFGVGNENAEVMFIGDSEVDVYTARNISAGKGVAVTWGYRTREELAASGAELFADTPAQILELL